MRIQNQLVGGRIVEYSHLFGADEDEALLFEGMKPAHANVGQNTAREGEMTQRDVGDATAQIVAAFAGYRFRFLAVSAEHHADIVRSKAPEDVFLGPDLAHIEAVRIDVLDAAEGAAIDQFLQFPDSRVGSEDVADHQDAAILAGEFD